MFVFKSTHERLLAAYGALKRVAREALDLADKRADRIAELERDRMALALRNSGLTQLLREAHFRDPETGRLLPKGQIPTLDFLKGN